MLVGMQGLEYPIQLVRCAIQIKRVGGAHIQMDLAAKIAADCGPLLHYAIGDVVMLLPIRDDFRIDVAGVVIEHGFRPTSLTSRRKDPIERPDLAAVLTEDVFQLGEFLEGRHHFSLIANDGIRCAVGLAIDIRMRRAQIDAGKVMKIAWVW